MVKQVSCNCNLEQNNLILNYRKRKSVIVKHSTEEVPYKVGKLDEETTEKNLKAGQKVQTEEVNTSIIRLNPVEKVKLDLGIPAINAMCTNYLVQEEKTHLEMIKITFTKAWDEISLGERIMTDYTKFCETKKEFASEYFLTANRQIRYF